jgi:PASTA domain
MATSRRSSFGLGPEKLAVSWASSAVFACVNTQRRGLARGLATEYLAWKRVAALDTVAANDELKATATEKRTEAERRLRKAIKEAYQHVVYLADDGAGGREDRAIRLQKENQSALDGQIVWAALDDAGKAFGAGQFDAASLIHNLRAQDWGKPLSEIRDGFWNTPRLPLLPNGDAELRAAVYSAVRAGDLLLVGGDGTPRTVTTAADVNLIAAGIRIQKPGTTDQDEDVTVPDVVGKEWPAGRLALETAGLIPVSTNGDGTIKSQTPPAGSTIPKGSQVTVQVAGAGNKPTVEHQVTLSAIKSLRDDSSSRDAIRNLLNEIKNAVDGDASHIQLSVKITAPTPTKEGIIARAEEAGLNASVIDL